MIGIPRFPATLAASRIADLSLSFTLPILITKASTSSAISPASLPSAITGEAPTASNAFAQSLIVTRFVIH